MRVRNILACCSTLSRPFAGQGMSVYAGTTLPLRYRNLGVQQTFVPRVRLSHLPLTTRVASAAGDAGEELSASVDLSAFAPGTVFLDVRTYRDGIELETVHPQMVTLTEAGNEDRSIDSSGTLTAIEIRTGGVVRFSLDYLAAETGVRPLQLELVPVSGPDTPATVATFVGPTGAYRIDSPPLLDTDVYSFTIDAVLPAVVDPETEEEITAEVRKTLITIEDVQADASGPPAVSLLQLEAV